MASLIPVANRVVEHPNRYKLVPVEGEENVYDFVPQPGTVAAEGTPVDKALLESMQNQTITLEKALAKVAKSGSYNDLSSRPYIPSDSSVASSIIRIGTYTGNDSTQTINVGVSIKAVLINNKWSNSEGTFLRSGIMALRGYPCCYASGPSQTLASISGNTFTVTRPGSLYSVEGVNTSGQTYYYIAFM